MILKYMESPWSRSLSLYLLKGIVYTKNCMEKLNSPCQSWRERKEAKLNL